MGIEGYTLYSLLGPAWHGRARVPQRVRARAWTATALVRSLFSMPNPYYRRSRPLALAAKWAGLVLVLLGLAGFFSIDTASRLLDAGLPGVLVVLFGLLGAGMFLVLVSGRIDAPSAAEVLAKDERPPILYLRSFSDDRAWATPSSFELQMRFGLGVLGPVIAIGRGDDRLPIIGVPRIYLSDDAGWKDEIRTWMSRAALLVFRAGRSDGLAWEMQIAFKTLPPERIVIVVPGRKVWRHFHAWARDTLPIALPETVGDAKPQGTVLIC